MLGDSLAGGWDGLSGRLLAVDACRRRLGCPRTLLELLTLLSVCR